MRLCSDVASAECDVLCEGKIGFANRELVRCNLLLNWKDNSMNRYVSALMIGLMATAFSVANQDTPERPAGDFGGQMMKCAKTCSECQLVCDACFKHCLSLTGETQKEHEKTAQLCADCAEVCKACATLCARESLLSKHMLECCVKRLQTVCDSL